MIPGGNILNLALTIIAKQPMQYVAYTGRTVVANGDYVPAYTTPVNILGQIQPVQRNLYGQLGLDFQRNYFTVFVPQNVVDVNRGTASDQIIYKGMTLQALSNMPWVQMDGWMQTTFVQVA